MHPAGPDGTIERESAGPRDHRLDRAKALATSLVLFWHLQPLVRLEAEGTTPLGKAAAAVLTLFNYQVCLLAVPLFFLVSLHLFHARIIERPQDAALRRIRRVGSVYLFWVGCQFALHYAIASVRLLATGESRFSVDLPPHLLAMQGGPSLPIIGMPVFYFLFVLLVLVVLSNAFQSSSLPAPVLRRVAAALALAFVAYFECLNLRGGGVAFWRVDNFILYAPISFLLFGQSRENLLRFAVAGCAGYLLFSMQDIYLRSEGQSSGGYSRVSVVCGAVALLCFFLRARNVPASPAAAFLSRYSLGIFATHKYWQLIVTAVFLAAGLGAPIRAASFPFDLRSLGIAVLSAALTLAGVAVGGRTVFRRFLR
jgi:surface polysaccharide O-acyltransferase-like enzyme